MQQQLEQYLDSLEKPLSTLTAIERREWRLEAEQHLSSLAAAHEELGLEREAALEAAIAQFGDAQVIARRMRREAAERKIHLNPVQAVAAALLGQLLVTVCILVPMGVISTAYIKGSLPYEIFAVASGALSVCPPIIGGALLGWNLHRFRIARSANGGGPDRTAFAFYVAILSELLVLGMSICVLGDFVSPLQNGPPTLDARFSLLWAALTIISAGAGSRWSLVRRRHRMAAPAQ